jgi:hypothetical protein
MSLLSHARRAGLVAAAVLAAAVTIAAPASAIGAAPAAQAQQLQARVDSYVAKTGGVQIAPDRIELKGATIQLATPNRPAALCDYTDMCAWSERYFLGDVIRMHDCDYYPIPWHGNGSWINNQTTGTRADFLRWDYSVGWTSGGAYDSDFDAPWDWVAYIHNC